MPLPDETPRQSVANLIGRFEQQGKRSTPTTAPPAPTSTSTISARSIPTVASCTSKKLEELGESKEMPVLKDSVREVNTTSVKTKPPPRRSVVSPTRRIKMTTTSALSSTAKRSDTSTAKSLTRSPPSKSSGGTPATIGPQHTGSSTATARATGAAKTVKSSPSSFQITPAPVATPPRAKTPSSSQSRLYAPTAASLARSSGPPETKPKTLTVTPAKPVPKKTTTIPASSRTAPPSNYNPKILSSRKPPVPAATATHRPPVPSTSSTSTTKPRVSGETKKTVTSHRQSLSATTDAAPQAEPVAEAEASFVGSEYTGNITHLSSHTQGEQEIENYDEDFPETDAENQILPTEAIQIEEVKLSTESVNDVHEKACVVQPPVIEEVALPVSVEHLSQGGTGSIGILPVQNQKEISTNGKGRKGASEEANQEEEFINPSEIIAPVEMAPDSAPPSVNDNISKLPETEKDSDSEIKDEHVTAAIEPVVANIGEEESKMGKAEVPALAVEPEPEEQSTTELEVVSQGEQSSVELSTKYSSPDLEDAVRMLEGATQHPEISYGRGHGH